MWLGSRFLTHKNLPWLVNCTQERSLIAWYSSKKPYVLLNLTVLWAVKYSFLKRFFITWFSTNWHVDRLISFWSRSQMVLQALWEWLSLVNVVLENNLLTRFWVDIHVCTVVWTVSSLSEMFAYCLYKTVATYSSRAYCDGY